MSKKNLKTPAAPIHRHDSVHSLAHRLEGVVKNKGIRPLRKPKSKRASAHPDWLLKAQAAVRYI